MNVGYNGGRVVALQVNLQLLLPSPINVCFDLARVIFTFGQRAV